MLCHKALCLNMQNFISLAPLIAIKQQTISPPTTYKVFINVNILKCCFLEYPLDPDQYPTDTSSCFKHKEVDRAQYFSF